MNEKITIRLAFILTTIFFPYLFTTLVNGRALSVNNKLSSIKSGHEVIININGANVLMDVEQYILGILPGIISPKSDQEKIEAQVVALRTKIYYEMGEETVIFASKLDFTYYTKDDCIKKWGSTGYTKAKIAYENAILATIGKLLK